MDLFYPALYIYGDRSKSNNTTDEAKVRIAYGRERKEASRGDEADWICKVVSLLVYAAQA